MNSVLSSLLPRSAVIEGLRWRSSNAGLAFGARLNRNVPAAPRRRACKLKFGSVARLRASAARVRIVGRTHIQSALMKIRIERHVRDALTRSMQWGKQTLDAIMQLQFEDAGFREVGHGMRCVSDGAADTH